MGLTLSKQRFKKGQVVEIRDLRSSFRKEVTIKEDCCEYVLKLRIHAEYGTNDWVPMYEIKILR
tara:strand:+ start:774 stop:965 length:192 start_codon:yes stop_codon:yes gene_type:complete